ncbi:MAG: hypothetical protein KDA45_06230, partial [Planctomycetales bacterium]|nr:hypothetical protein [Planctomycetales bacterium]
AAQQQEREVEEQQALATACLPQETEVPEESGVSEASGAAEESTSQLAVDLEVEAAAESTDELPIESLATSSWQQPANDAAWEESANEAAAQEPASEGDWQQPANETAWEESADEVAAGEAWTESAIEPAEPELSQQLDTEQSSESANTWPENVLPENEFAESEYAESESLSSELLDSGLPENESQDSDSQQLAWEEPAWEEPVWERPVTAGTEAMLSAPSDGDEVQEADEFLFEGASLDASENQGSVSDLGDARGLQSVEESSLGEQIFSEFDEPQQVAEAASGAERVATPLAENEWTTEADIHAMHQPLDAEVDEQPLANALPQTSTHSLQGMPFTEGSTEEYTEESLDMEVEQPAAGLPSWWVDEGLQDNEFMDAAQPNDGLLPAESVSETLNEAVPETQSSTPAEVLSEEFFGLGLMGGPATDSNVVDSNVVDSSAEDSSAEDSSAEESSAEELLHAPGLLAAEQLAEDTGGSQAEPSLPSEAECVLQAELLVDEEEVQPGIALDLAADRPEASPIEAGHTDSVAAETPPTGTAVSSGLASDGTAAAEEDEDSVEDYMQKLLARMRGGSDSQSPAPKTENASVQSRASASPAASENSTSPSSTKPASSAAAGANPSAQQDVSLASGTTGLTTAPLSVESTEPFDPEKYMPRALAPEKTQNFAAMRELANSSARTAIHKSTRQRHMSSVLLKAGIATVGLIVGGVLLIINGVNLNVGLIATIASFLVAAIWGYDAASSLKPLLQAGLVLQPQIQRTPLEAKAEKAGSESKSEGTLASEVDEEKAAE